MLGFWLHDVIHCGDFYFILPTDLRELGGKRRFQEIKSACKTGRGGGGGRLLKHNLMAMTHPVTPMMKAAGIIRSAGGGGDDNV